MMKSYDEVVTNMICFLKNRNICQSSINSHKDCYRSFQRFIQKNNCQWEQSAVSSWITELRKTNPRQLCTVWNQYMRQLDEYCHTGTVEDRHLYLTLTLYERLGGGMKPDLDDYLWTCKSRYSKRSWHLAQNYLAGMLIYFEDRGRYSVSEISYQDIIAYQASDFSCSRKTRAVYLGHARRFFEFMSLKHKCPAGYALYHDDRNAPYVGSLENFDAGLRTRIAAVADESRDFPADEFYSAVNEYIGSLKAHKYAATSIKTAKHVLTVLYLFMDIHSLGYHPEIAAAWFSGIRFMVTGTNVQVDKDDHNKKLQDAVFTLRKLSSPEGRPEDPPEPLPSGKFPGIIVGDSQPTVKDTGKTTFTGLTHGYYEITEKIPPKGYVMTDALAIYFKIEGGKVSRIEWSSERSEWIDKGDDTIGVPVTGKN